MNSRTLLTFTLFAALGFSVWYMMRTSEIRKRPDVETIVIGTNAEFAPFSFINKNNEIIGFDIDVAQEVAKRLNMPTQIKSMPFDALIPEIQLGKVHIIAAGMTPSPERAKRVLFAKPHLQGAPLVIVSLAAKTPVYTLDDLKGTVVAVNEGYTADTFMSEIKDIELMRISSAMVSEGILALQSDRAVAFVTAQNTLHDVVQKYGEDTFVISPIPDTQESSAIAISKQYPELLPKIQNVLDAMEKDGTIETLKTKWNV